MKRVLLLALASTTAYVAHAQQNTSDTQWEKQEVILKGSMEAEFIIRVGDVDNMGFGWPEGFDPFCGRMTEVHAYPWEAKPNDVPGLDRILLSSKFKPVEHECGDDGYSAAFDPKNSKPVPYKLPINDLKTAAIENAFLQLFIDDFQSPTFCSKFNITLNGKRFVEGERILNAIDQTGPVGKLVTLPIPEEFYADLNAGGVLTVFIDETKGTGDGFALDFVRLLVNRKRENACKGNIFGYVRDRETSAPIRGALVNCPGFPAVKTNAEGYFSFQNIPTGFEVLSAGKIGYKDGAGTADIGQGADNPEVEIYLEKGSATANFEGKDLKAGESISLNKILFDQSKAELRAESIAELDKLLAFMKENPSAEIELSGHTSSEGDASLNRSLSYKRVKACKDYMVAKGIDTARISILGYGPDRPVAPNNTEVNRALNRRVEMRLLKL